MQGFGLASRRRHGGGKSDRQYRVHQNQPLGPSQGHPNQDTKLNPKMSQTEATIGPPLALAFPDCVDV